MLKSKVIDPFFTFEKKVNEMYLDMLRLQRRNTSVVNSLILLENARGIMSIPEGWGDLVITSPPYANNYDYADAIRFEMTFLGDITGWTDLQESVRKNLVRACTQHVSKLGNEIDELLSNKKLSRIHQELVEVFLKLKAERLTHGGKKIII